MVDELEAFIAREDLWRPAALRSMAARLEAEEDLASRRVGANLAGVLRRSQGRRRPSRLVADIEGVVYPRLWKVMEGVWDGLPECELRIRVEVLDQRLSPLLTEPA